VYKRQGDGKASTRAVFTVLNRCRHGRLRSFAGVPT
jgi:hypothetical protein